MTVIGRRRLAQALAALAVAGLVTLAGCGSPAGPSTDRTASAPPAAASPRQSATTTTVGDLPATTTVVFVDVGQGDAAILKSGSWTGLIDGGRRGSDAVIEAACRRLGVDRLDALVVSHMHADHTGGLPEVVRDLHPQRAYMAGTATVALGNALREAGTSVVQVRRGDTVKCGAAQAEVLSPAGLSGDPNQDSVVLLFEAGGRRLLFTGDCTGPNEAAVGKICARGPPIYLLKVAHHGSRYSTTAAFLSGARPSVAVISVGRNSYGHPSTETVARLQGAGARVLTTQDKGNITLTITAGGSPSWSFAR